jgi:hypothetical protein
LISCETITNRRRQSSLVFVIESVKFIQYKLTIVHVCVVVHIQAICGTIGNPIERKDS